MDTAPASTFFIRLQITVYSLLLLVLGLYILREFQAILQPLFVAIFLGYLILPAHRWIVSWGVRPAFAGVTLLVLVLFAFFTIGTILYRNVQTLTENLPTYAEMLDSRYQEFLEMFPKDWQQKIDVAVQESHLRQIAGGAQLKATLQTTLGSFVNFFTGLAVVCVYLIFLSAERASFPVRVHKALGDIHGTEVQDIFRKISHAISDYVGVKTFVSLLGGSLTYVVLFLFGIDFAMTWGLLTFLLNFIPYLGSLIAVVMPVAMAFLQYDSWWAPILILALLIAIQQIIGVFLEPRMTGQKLGVSPLLILLALSFWGLVWGVVGMILAVPLLMCVKIALEQIHETKPLALLMSNQ